MDIYRSSMPAFIGINSGCMHGCGPAEKPFGIRRAHVDTAMAHGSAKVIMPVGAMKGMTAIRKITRPGNTGQNIILHLGIDIGLSHVFRRQLFNDAE